MSYSFTSRVRFSETGTDKKLTLEGILDYFQDCATFHSESLGLGMEYLAKRDQAWFLSAWQICIDRRPDVCENIVVTTWPYEFKGFLGFRNFTMETPEGERLAWANSVWTFLSLSTGHPIRVTEDMQKGYVSEPRLDMDYAPRKVIAPKAGQPMDPIVVRREHLDFNGHVNNGKYVQLAADFLPADFKVGQMRAEYKRQAMPGDLLYPLVEQQGEICTVALCDADGQPYAVMAFTNRV